MEEGMDGVPPLASAAAWSPQATPPPSFESQALKIDESILHAAAAPAPEREPELPPAPEPELRPAPQSALRSEPEPALRPAPESALRPEPEPALPPAPESVLRSAPEPELRSAREPELPAAPEPALRPEPELPPGASLSPAPPAAPAPVQVAPAPVAPVAPAPVVVVDRLAALRDIARKLRTAPEAEETLQFVIDIACQCTSSDAGMLTLQAPHSRQFVAGTALGAGPYISLPLRVGGPSFGEIVLTRMADAPEYLPEDETLGELVAEYVAKAVSGLRSGTVLSQEEQDFIDRMTEEMRTPLASAVNVLGVVTGGGSGALPAEAQTYLSAAYTDVRRLLASIDDLMTLAHLRPCEPREMETIPVGPWLARCGERHQAAAAERGVALTYRPVPEAYLVQGVMAQLDVVIDQLVGNAVKFTESGGRVDVTAGMAEGMLRITVRDNGMGFDTGEAARMTECFSRSTNAEASRIPGLGVGLFLANEIVKNHGGRLWLESRRDEGTQAHVALTARS
jgi:signal transduction histidine kinase